MVAGIELAPPERWVQESQTLPIRHESAFMYQCLVDLFNATIFISLIVNKCENEPCLQLSGLRCGCGFGSQRRHMSLDRKTKQNLDLAWLLICLCHRQTKCCQFCLTKTWIITQVNNTGTTLFKLKIISLRRKVGIEK